MRFHLVVSREVQNKARQIFAEQLKRTGLRDYELEVRSFSDDEVET